VVSISASGANAGYVNIYLEDVWASDCSYISSESSDYAYYYYCLLKSRQQEIFNFQKGAAQPHVYPKDIMRLEVINPPNRLVALFTDSVEPFFALIRNLKGQTNALKCARDLLLPRLMCAEIAA
jgi:type I restriction enzyme S subunit